MLDDRKISLGRKASVSVGTRAGAVLFVVAAVLLAGGILQLRADALNEARRDIENLAFVLAEQSARAVHTVDLALRDIQDSISQSGVESRDALASAVVEERFHRELQDKVIRLQYADVFAIIDANGRILNSSRDTPNLALDVS